MEHACMVTYLDKYIYSTENLTSQWKKIKQKQSHSILTCHLSTYLSYVRLGTHILNPNSHRQKTIKIFLKVHVFYVVWELFPSFMKIFHHFLIEMNFRNLAVCFSVIEQLVCNMICFYFLSLLAFQWPKSTFIHSFIHMCVNQIKCYVL